MTKQVVDSYNYEKRITLPLLLILLLSFNIKAQSKKLDRKQISVQPVIGLQMFGIEERSTLLSNDDISIAYGVFLDYRFVEKWGVKLGVLKLKSGGYFEYESELRNGDNFIHEAIVNGNGLSVPVIINHYFGKNARWNVGIGIDYNFIISSSDVYIISCGLCDTFELLDNYFGANLNLGYDIVLGNSIFNVNIGGSSSIETPFINISSTPPSQSLYSEFSQKSMSFAIAYKYKL